MVCQILAVVMRMMLYTTELPMKSVLPWRQYHPMLNKMTEKKMPPPPPHPDGLFHRRNDANGM
jgi:hypothetical protein